MTAAPLQILLIEDEPPVRRVLTRLLTSLGHTVREAASGREGLAQLEAGEPVDLVLTNLRMPDMSGWEVIKAVKARWPRLRVGIVTGTPQLLSQEPVQADLVITKPITLKELRDSISRLGP